jgi:hypothetical protein
MSIADEIKSVDQEGLELLNALLTYSILVPAIVRATSRRAQALGVPKVREALGGPARRTAALWKFQRVSRESGKNRVMMNNATHPGRGTPA